MTAILDAILNISKCSMMPEWHQLNSSSTMPEQQESTEKKNFKIKFQVILVYYRTRNKEKGSSCYSLTVSCANAYTVFLTY